MWARLSVWKSILHINIHLSPKFRGRPESSAVHTKPDGEGLLGRLGLPLAVSVCRGARVSLIIFSMFCTRNVSQKGLSAPFAKLFHNNVMLRESGCKLFFGRLLDQLGQRGSGGSRSRRRRRRRLLSQQWYLPATSVRTVLRAAKLRTLPRFEQTQWRYFSKHGPQLAPLRVRDGSVARHSPVLSHGRAGEPAGHLVFLRSKY